MQTLSAYTGRFAPSPSGPLHDGSLVAAMASYLDAKAHHGRWLLRIEDIDTPRTVTGADKVIMQQLQALGMHWDGEVIYQSQRLNRYQECFDLLNQQGLIYGCSCTRKIITDNAIALGIHKSGQYPYLGTCRQGAKGIPRAWRLIMPEGLFSFEDRWLGRQEQNIQQEIGDIIIKRADKLFAYQFVVVIDDFDQGVTDIVRGQDILDSTLRQQCIGHYLGFPSIRYLHVPLVMDSEGRKLSKQNHANPINLSNALQSLDKAWRILGFNSFHPKNIEAFWSEAVVHWAQRFVKH
ncbi:glutamyl-Q-tRNA synthetase [Pelistega indica]|uniref:Glutamyl-Q tRNA(Asp) synthetase n=1 Tax=Pelistega indica TaxID=1414851 RepID=V8G244_9BURK|nr:tRNA glutamyl-Q(34) synthetase GluQRS [Pelistega indica]ETD70028.1 glutamyl-Q-tRNA synthetase [Pelistega indica]